MIPIDLSGKVALVTGVGDNKSFAWFIAKALQAAGARLVWAVHPRMIRIVEAIVLGDDPEDVASRVLPFGAGTLKVEKILPCDVSYDTHGGSGREDPERSPLCASRSSTAITRSRG